MDQERREQEPDEVKRSDEDDELHVRRHGTRVPRREGREAPLRYHPGPLMAASESTSLAVVARPVEGSRAARRLRRAGLVPGVVYGGGEQPLAFAVEARTLRQALAHAGAVLDLALDGEATAPVVLKDLQRHPVSGATLHVDLLRVRLDRAIHATVTLELTGVEEAPGVVEGGVIEQVTRDLSIEALPTAIPDVITHDVSGMAMHETVTLAAVRAPDGVTLLDDPEETVVATLTPPRLEVESDEIEQETQLVGDGEGEGGGGEPAAEGEPGGE